MATGPAYFIVSVCYRKGFLSSTSGSFLALQGVNSPSVRHTFSTNKKDSLLIGCRTLVGLLYSAHKKCTGSKPMLYGSADFLISVVTSVLAPPLRAEPSPILPDFS
ncbi:hypothetical protein HMPREF0083_00999 [Aneurinibacillus aneurinilyticus ATCC 12856]|uniref:Uncharacterized protein n=1 Tax=Aneurinibacillus aneurinilyticus ATCC 12856 TaxID=649747 RepID=U1YFM8_ANEAE|nr:hypothetical protein HMPREF0083_00999 [Aneurinibacillus aneurinilyticus ATCC 12856]